MAFRAGAALQEDVLERQAPALACSYYRGTTRLTVVRQKMTEGWLWWENFGVGQKSRTCVLLPRTEAFGLEQGKRSCGKAAHTAPGRKHQEL